MSSLEYAVIGGGAMGLATAWQLSEMGHEVTVFEQFDIGHLQGASHGATRNFNIGYWQPHYIQLLETSYDLWAELSQRSGKQLLTPTGVLNHGPTVDYTRSYEALLDSRFEVELLPPEEAARRWPGFRFTTDVLWAPQAGQIRAEESLHAMAGAIQSNGGFVRNQSAVTDIKITGDQSVQLRVQTCEGNSQTFTARHLVVTAGAWSSGLLADLFPGLSALRVTEEQPLHFVKFDDSFQWPGFNHKRDLVITGPDPEFEYWPAAIYGMHTPGEGIKIGWHLAGPEVTPATRTFEPTPALVKLMLRYVHDWVPGVDTSQYTDVSCTYTSRPSEDFILERSGPITVGAGFAGHGFKFTPAIGLTLARMATGTGQAAEAFRL